MRVCILIVLFITPLVVNLAAAAVDWDNIVSAAENAMVRVETNLGSGSGFFVSPEGHILTAAHVVAGAEYIRAVGVTRSYSCRLLVADYSFDVAILMAETSAFTNWLPLANGETPEYDEELMSIGYPLPQAGVGLISARGNFQGFRNRSGVKLLQHTCPVDAGHSGGATLDSEGRVVGLVTEHWSGYSDFSLSVSYVSLRSVIPVGILPDNPVAPPSTQKVVGDLTPARVTSHVFEILSSDPSWQPTGLYIQAGTDMVFRAYGQIIYAKASCSSMSSGGYYRRPSSECPDSGIIIETCGPNGESSRYNGGALVSSIGEKALVGKLDRSPSPYSYVFVVGSALSLKAEFSGYLYLGMNDDGSFRDNEGSWIVELTIFEYE